MKGFMSIDIPTKAYIKAYIISKLGDKPEMISSNLFGNKLIDLLEHKTNERKTEFANARYTTTIRVYIPMRTFRVRGFNLNETNIKNFNQFVELLIKHRYYELMDDAIEILASFEAHLPYVRRKLGIDIEAWSDDSMKKDYYRYRQNNKKRLFYNKINSRTVLSESAANIPF